MIMKIKYCRLKMILYLQFEELFFFNKIKNMMFF